MGGSEDMADRPCHPARRLGSRHNLYPLHSVSVAANEPVKPVLH